MLDKGRPQAAKVTAIGNWWHGYYSASTGWRNRAHAAMPGFVVNAAAAARIVPIRADAHLVDFGMPTVTTPAADAAAGMERWNKAILHGEYKHYSIHATKQFGIGGWPYKAPDGTVFFMRAEFFSAPNRVEVRARVLDVQFNAPNVLCASLALTYAGDVMAVNFSPDGGKAAIHCYDPDFVIAESVWDNAAPLWIAEALVSGGSASVPPTVALSLTCDRDTAVVIDPGTTTLIPVMEFGWTESVGEYTYINETTREADVTITPVLQTKMEGGSPVMQQAWSGNKITRIGMITYAPDGSRREIAAVLRTYLETKERWASNTTPGVYRVRQGWVGGSWETNTVTAITPCSPTMDRNMEQVRKADLERDDVSMSAITANETWVARTTYQFQWSGSDFPYFQSFSSSVVDGTLAQVGNGWAGSVYCIDNPAVPFRFRRMASNVHTMLVATSTLQLLGWSAAHGAGQMSYSVPMSLTGNRMPAVNPETGELSASVRLYF